MALESIAALPLAKEIVGGQGADKEIAARLANEANENAHLAQQLTRLESISQAESFRINDFKRNEIGNSEELKKRELASANELNNKIRDSLENDSKEIDEEPKFYSTELERLYQTPNENVEWPSGERGVGECVPKDPEMQEELAKFGQKSVFYNKDHIPDFSPVSIRSVEIENMSTTREPRGNYEYADKKLAEQFNAEKYNGKDNWDSSDVRKWRREDLQKETGEIWSWHEEPDRKTCRLIPTKINDVFKHLGGVGECRRRDAAFLNNNEVKFDD